MIEALMGFEIVDEHDQSANMQAVAKQMWRQRLESSNKLLSAENTMAKRKN
jgi:hypothetical protein